MRFRIVLVWLLLTLLPMRGWATLAMQLQPPANHSSSAAQPTPCHEMAAMLPVVVVGADVSADADRAAAEAPSGGSMQSHAGCSMCDLCHGAAACNAQRAPSFALNRVARVQPAADAQTGRALVGGLERPPRTLHL